MVKPSTVQQLVTIDLNDIFGTSPGLFVLLVPRSRRHKLPHRKTMRLTDLFLGTSSRVGEIMALFALLKLLLPRAIIDHKLSSTNPKSESWIEFMCSSATPTPVSRPPPVSCCQRKKFQLFKVPIRQPSSSIHDPMVGGRRSKFLLLCYYTDNNSVERLQ